MQAPASAFYDCPDVISTVMMAYRWRLSCAWCDGLGAPQSLLTANCISSLQFGTH
jgi:hypothetical protein